MPSLTAMEEYQKALKRGLREVQQEGGVLLTLDEILTDRLSVSEVPLGTIEIPLNLVVGTYTALRSNSFSKSFMPLMPEDTEFANKWCSLYQSHLDEGIREPVICYEYLNRFYIQEGNKRVSVLNYTGALTVMAKVIRLLPQYDASKPEIVQYYEFLKFYEATKINAIWVTKPGGFAELLSFYEQFHPTGFDEEEKSRIFTNHIYYLFRKYFKEYGGDRLDITTGDAFLEYMRIYGIPDDSELELLQKQLKTLIPELAEMGHEKIDIQQELPTAEKRVMSAFSPFAKIGSSKKQKVAFIYGGSKESSSWTFAHEMGRQHVAEVLGEQVETVAVDNVTPEALYETLKSLAEEGVSIVFTTLPSFITPTLKAALEFPNIKFLNCSVNRSYKNVTTYYARIHEAHFLSGVIAGAMSKTGVVGYEAACPIPEHIASVNAFALGARMVLPDAEIHIAWTNQYPEQAEATHALFAENCDIILHQNSLVAGVGEEFGLFQRRGEREKSLALPVWDWGIIYESILKELLQGGAKAGQVAFSGKSKRISLWCGLDVGAVDLFYSKSVLPKGTQKLVEALKYSIVNGYNVFTGPIYDQSGKMRIRSGRSAGVEQILKLDWFVEGIKEPLPEIQEAEAPTLDMLEIAED